MYAYSAMFNIWTFKEIKTIDIKFIANVKRVLISFSLIIGQMELFIFLICLDHIQHSLILSRCRLEKLINCLIVTGCVRSMTVRYCFHRCLSVQRGRGYPKVPTPMARSWWWEGVPQGTYPPPPDRTAYGVLDTLQFVCLLRSCRRPFLVIVFIFA